MKVRRILSILFIGFAVASLVTLTSCKSGENSETTPTSTHTNVDF